MRTPNSLTRLQHRPQGGVVACGQRPQMRERLAADSRADTAGPWKGSPGPPEKDRLRLSLVRDSSKTSLQQAGWAPAKMPKRSGENESLRLNRCREAYMLRQGRSESVGRSFGILRLRRCAGIASRLSFRPVCPPWGHRLRKTKRGGRFSAIRNIVCPEKPEIFESLLGESL